MTTFFHVRGRYEDEARDPSCGATPYATREAAEAAVKYHRSVFGGGDTITIEEVSGELSSLADARTARPGRCGVSGCDCAGDVWYRTSQTPAGTRAVRACRKHAAIAYGLLRSLTMADCVRLATPAAKKNATRLAETARESATRHSRESARLAGASSATHTHALLGAACEVELACQVAFAEAVNAG